MSAVEMPPFEQLGRHLVDGDRDCVKILDHDGRVIYLNPAGVNLLALCGAEDLINRVWVDLWEGEHRAAAVAALARARTGERVVFEGLCRTAAGIARWWEVVASPLHDHAAADVPLLVVSRDITERRREAEFRTGQRQVLEMIATGASLEAVLGRLVRLIEDQADGMLCSVLLLDDDGVHVRHGAAPSLPPSYINAVDGAAIGPRAGSCGTAMYLGLPVIAVDILVDPRWEDYRELAVACGLRACWSTPILSAQGKVLGSFAMYYAQPRGPRDDEIRLIDLAANISRVAIEHQRAQEALHRSEARNRAILRAIPDWMFILSVEGVFLDYHAKDPTTLFVPPHMFLGKRLVDVLPPAVAQPLSAAFARVLASDETERVEYSLEANRSQAFYEACLVRCEGDKILSIVRDITDRKRAEMDATHQRRELAHLSRVATVGELSGALAHELSQPLSAILLNAQAARRMISQNPVDLKELGAALDDIIANDKRAGAVIDRLRALLRKGDNVVERLNLNDVTREVLDLARSDLFARRVSVTTHLGSSVPDVSGNRVQFQQVILNLVLNACEAMIGTEPGERRLVVTTGVADEIVEMSITDQGVGIPEGQLEAVFQPFVTFRNQGLGLGLAISRSIVQAHGGRISAENNATGGATFRCFFPVASA